MNRRDAILGSLVAPFFPWGKKAKAKEEVVKKKLSPVVHEKYPATYMFEHVAMQDGWAAEFPLDFLAPDNTNEMVAFEWNCNSKQVIEVKNADYITVQMGLNPLQNKHEIEDAALKLLIYAGTYRNIAVFDCETQPGEFRPRLVALMKATFKDNLVRDSCKKLTHILCSTSAHADTVFWRKKYDEDGNLIEDGISETIKRNPDGTASEVLGVQICPVENFSDYMNYYKNIVHGSLATDHDEELIVGVSAGDAFVCPTRATTCGLAVLDSRRIILGSC
jgi:hypothetical protein